MSLIVTPEHTPADLRAWEDDVSRDLVWARRPQLAELARRSLAEIVAFAAEGPCYASASWGKDSTVLAHLCWIAQEEHGSEIPMGWVRVRPGANPWCHLVRDAFLERWPVTYHEVEIQVRPGESTSTATHGRGFRELDRVMGSHRYLSGVRADESRGRAIRVAKERAGIRMRSGAPLGDWTTRDVFAWLALHDLPVHPTYAMTMDGRLSRESLRVASIGGERGREFGREEWERRYAASSLVD